MLIQHEWHSYNHRRYGKPWAAQITFEGTKPIYAFTGLYSNGVLAFDAEPGEIIAMGQKDLRGGKNTSNDWYVVGEQGLSYLAGGKVEALQLHRERELADRINAESAEVQQAAMALVEGTREIDHLRKVQATLVSRLEILAEWITHLKEGRDLDATMDMGELVDEMLALAKGSPTPTESKS